MGGFLLSSTTNAIGIHPAAGCSTGRDIPQEAEEHQQETAGCSCSTGRNMSARGSRMLHRQEYVRRRQQDAPQAGIYRRRQRNINRRQRDAPAPQAGICPQEAAGCSTGRNISGRCSRMLHRQEYVRRRQQDAPQAGIYRKRQRDKY